MWCVDFHTHEIAHISYLYPFNPLHIPCATFPLQSSHTYGMASIIGVSKVVFTFPTSIFFVLV
eukprot:c52802_g1_i1 orf=30-218(+)